MAAKGGVYDCGGGHGWVREGRVWQGGMYTGTRRMRTS
jgi:hypothetical protein